MKKLFILLTVAGSLAACGNGNSGGNNTTPDSLSTGTVITDSTTNNAPMTVDSSKNSTGTNTGTGKTINTAGDSTSSMKTGVRTGATSGSNNHGQ